MKKIICYGDSNTFGYIPKKGGRYDRHTRWLGRLQELLGSSWEVVEEGLCGRTTAFEDKTCPGRCGLALIGDTLKNHDSIDILVIMLGSNDCKSQFRVSSGQIKGGLEKIIEEAKASVKTSFQILLIAPAPITENVLKSGFGMEFDETSMEVSRALAREYKELAAEMDCAFLDAAEAAHTDQTDGLHLDAEGHLALAEAAAKKIREMNR